MKNESKDAESRNRPGTEAVVGAVAVEDGRDESFLGAKRAIDARSRAAARKNPSSSPNRQASPTRRENATAGLGTAYHEKLAMDAKSRQVRGAPKSPPKSPTSTYSRKLALDTRSRQVRGNSKSKHKSPAASADKNAEDRKTRIANRSHKRQENRKVQSQNYSPQAGEAVFLSPDSIPSSDDHTAAPEEDIEMNGNGTIGAEPMSQRVPSQRQLFSSHQQEEEGGEETYSERNVVQMESSAHRQSSNLNSNLIEAYTVTETQRDEFIPLAEAVDENKQRRKLAVGGFLLVLLVVAVSVGLVVPLSKRTEDTNLMASVSPSGIPSASPSALPSMSMEPSSAPSNLPTFAPTADFCSLKSPHNMTCKEVVTGMDCDDYQNQWYAKISNDERRDAVCRSDPINIEWIHNGGPCSQVWLFSDGKIECVDYNGGPARERGTPTRIKIVSNTLPGLVYYDDLITLGSTFWMEQQGLEPIADLLNISVYEFRGKTSTETLVQNSVVPWYCKLGKRKLGEWYGALQATSFTNIEQGFQTNFLSFSSLLRMALTVDVQNMGVTGVVLETFTVTSNFEPFFFDFTAALDGGVFLQAGESDTFAVEHEHYMVEDSIYVLMPNATGLNEGQVPCRATEQKSLSLRLDAPGHFHDSSQDEAIELEADDDFFGEVDPDAPCNTKASLHCVGRTVSGSLSCDDVLRFTGTYPSQIQFKLEEGVCNNDISSVSWCEDQFRGVSGRRDYYGVVLKVADGEVLFQEVVALGENVTLESKFGLGPYVDVEIFDSGNLVQKQRIWTNEEETFIAGQKFGGLLLTSFEASISERPLASVNFQLSIENQGNATSNITSAVITSIPGGEIVAELVESNYPEDILSISPTESKNLPFFLSVRVDDWLHQYKETTTTSSRSSSSLLAWTASISGIAENGMPCQDSTSADFSDLLV